MLSPSSKWQAAGEKPVRPAAGNSVRMGSLMLLPALPDIGGCEMGCKDCLSHYFLFHPSRNQEAPARRYTQQAQRNMKHRIRLEARAVTKARIQGLRAQPNISKSRESTRMLM